MNPKHPGLRPPWQKGQSGNPKGRQVGSRNVLDEDFLYAYLSEFRKSGAGCLEKLAATNPGEFLRIGVAILPRHHVASTKALTPDDLSTAELVARILIARTSGTGALEAPRDTEKLN
jgi:hypothetical protein